MPEVSIYIAMSLGQGWRKQCTGSHLGTGLFSLSERPSVHDLFAVRHRVVNTHYRIVYLFIRHMFVNLSLFVLCSKCINVFVNIYIGNC